MYNQRTMVYSITNASLHSDLLVPSVREVILHSFMKPTKKLENHLHTSAITPLDNSEVSRRLTSMKNHVLYSTLKNALL